MILRWLLFASFSVHVFAVCDDPNAQVIIVGGGPAGIYAATGLIEQHGIEDFLMLEETDRPEGYLYPIDFGGLSFRPGALYGLTPIKPLMMELGIGLVATDNSSYTVYNYNGEDVTAEAREREAAYVAAREKGLPLADDIDRCLRPRPDIPYKAKLGVNGWVAKSDIDKTMEWFNFDFNEGLSTRDVSTGWTYRQAMANLFPDKCFITGRARIILDGMLEQITPARIALNSRTVNVTQTDECVIVTTSDGTEYVGEYAIITNSVGVIQNGGVTFEPSLPPWKSEEFFRYQMGTLDAIFLKFDTKFWDDTEYILHATDRHGYYPAFLNLEAEGYHPAGTNILIGFLTGDEAYRAEHLSDEEVQAEVIGVLRDMYGESNVPDPTEFYMSRFATDVDIYGSFSAYPIGIPPEDSQMRLKGPTGRLYFAPEDAADIHIGNPFGSVLDGFFAAGGVAGCIQNQECDDYTPDRSICKPRPVKQRKNMN
ncbi:uncharacterized protein [Amphiura filiformis]|uniref:uncharacterized protein n=1 Tax=Amphiura filiformis TaxID=82378 RepID=UPI003B216134